MKGVMQPEQLVRYALPGGYGLLTAIVCEAVYGWAWRQSVGELISTARSDPILTAGGAVIVGFVIYELIYRLLDRRCIHLDVAVRLPAWTPESWRRRFGERALTLCTIYADDLGGEVFASLHDIPPIRRALEQAHGVDFTDLPGKAPRRGASQAEREAYAGKLSQRLFALHSLLRQASATGEPEIERNYARHADDFHAVGVSRATLIAISVTVAIVIIAKHWHAFVTHLAPSLGVTAMLLAVIWLALRAMSANRRHLWEVTTGELIHDLRNWALRHPQQLAPLAATHYDDYAVSATSRRSPRARAEPYSPGRPFWPRPRSSQR
jgi:hypothetical protein